MISETHTWNSFKDDEDMSRILYEYGSLVLKYENFLS